MIDKDSKQTNQTKLEAAIEKEERKLRDLNKREQSIKEEFKDGQPIEGAVKATEESIRRHLGVKSKSVVSFSSTSTTIRRALESQNLNPVYTEKDLSPAGRRSKRYYIRKRIEQGKPYIPQKVRILGKKIAREMGYKIWEVRNKERDEEEEEQAKELETENKLRLVFKMLGGRMKGYIKDAP